MSDQHNIVVDSWIREAEEATNVVEDLERRTKNKDVAKMDYMVRGSVESKLFEVGVKLDRLESLLRNPPSKLIFKHDELQQCIYRAEKDLEYRWKLLSDFRLRTRALALTLYTASSFNKTTGFASSSAQKTSKTTTNNDHDKTQFLKDDEELLRPLVDESATRSEAEMKQYGWYVSVKLVMKVCRIVCLIVGAALLLFILVIICAVI